MHSKWKFEFMRCWDNIVCSKCLYKATYVCSQLHCSYNIIAIGQKLVTSSCQWGRMKQSQGFIWWSPSWVPISSGKSEAMGLQYHLIISMLHRILLFTIKILFLSVDLLHLVWIPSSVTAHEKSQVPSFILMYKQQLHSTRWNFYLVQHC